MKSFNLLFNSKFSKSFFFIVIFTFSFFVVFAESLPKGYSSVELGMNLEQTKQTLLKQPSFGYRGERDVSLLPGLDNHLIETNGSGFLSDCWFQFYNDSLYVISINLNPAQMDYYSVFTTLCKKYGDPQLLNPEKAQWEDENVIMALEKPLCLKYTDNKVKNKLLNQSVVEETAMEKLRQGFLDSL